MMPSSDISKCNGDGCAKRDSCWRFVCPPNAHWQAYMQPVFEDGECQSFYPFDHITRTYEIGGGTK